ncbi:hypothetical protein BDZ97DRAFT_57970 [Flammula alnicola]|nr:hypothetical protein BDZ97DRAFT_57970 [Flammula alnicola]
MFLPLEQRPLRDKPQRHASSARCTTRLHFSIDYTWVFSKEEPSGHARHRILVLSANSGYLNKLMALNFCWKSCAPWVNAQPLAPLIIEGIHKKKFDARYRGTCSTTWTTNICYPRSLHPQPSAPLWTSSHCAPHSLRNTTDASPPFGLIRHPNVKCLFPRFREAERHCQIHLTLTKYP